MALNLASKKKPPPWLPVPQDVKEKLFKKAKKK